MRRVTRSILRSIKRIAKRLHVIRDQAKEFAEFEAEVHPGTWSGHEELLRWAEDWILGEECRVDASDDELVRQGIVLRRAMETRFQGSLAARSQLRFLIQVPDAAHSPAGHSLFTNLINALEYLGLPSRALHWNESIVPLLKTFAPTVFLTSDNSSYLSRIDWAAVKEYRKGQKLQLGLTAAVSRGVGGSLRSRLRWASENRVSFYYSFWSPECIEKSCTAFREKGYPVHGIEFGCNPLIYRPTPGVERDIDFAFFGSSNQEKWGRYFDYFGPIFRGHRGIITGPGWSKITRCATPAHMRVLSARAKVGLNLSIPSQVLEPRELNERTYNLAACGVPQLIDNPMLLPDRFSPDSMFVASSPAEYLDLFEWILADPEEGRLRAMKAQREAIEKHTVFHRASGLIAALHQSLA